MPSGNRFFRLTLSFLAAVLIAGAGVNILHGFAQSTEESWTEPINLSHSGSTLNPVAVVDSNGRIHVIWKDEFADWVYTSGDESGWDNPVAADYIFADQVPRLYPDASGGIQVLWIDPEGALYQGWSNAGGFGSPSTWSGTQLVGTAAANYDLALDSQGILHLAYVRNQDKPDFPAGVYYRRSTDNGASWSSPVMLYASAYMRSLTNENVVLDISVAGVDEAQELYVAFDNQPLHEIILVKSKDGGNSWGEPVSIDGPKETAMTNTPFSPTLDVNGNDVLIVWGTQMQSDVVCTLVFQKSSDGGETWHDRQSLYTELSGCPSENQFFTLDNGQTILMSTINDAVYLMSWDGYQWSDPQPQAELSTFTNPDTFTSVNLQCRQAFMTGLDILTVIGCDPLGTEDIWATSSQLGGVDEWFPPPNVWMKPQPLTTAEIADDSVTVLSDSNGGFHAIWNQLHESESGSSKWSIYYSHLEDRRWSNPVAVLDSPGGSIEEPSAVINTEDQLFVVWRASQTGEIYYSWADAGLAISPFEWNSPQLIPIPQGGGMSPDVLVDQNGELVVVYAVPVNEGRGIYLTRSADAGETWSIPVQVFDGEKSSWVMVDNPRLAITESGIFHLVWTRNTIGEVQQAVALYYAKSTDSGQSWSEAELVSEQPISWAAIESDGQNGVHRLWLGAEAEAFSLWDQSSLDDGSTWEHAANLTRFGEIPGPTSLTEDALERLNMLHVVSDVNGTVFIEHQIWENDVWNVQPSLKLGDANALQVTSLGTGTSVDGRLVAVFAQDDLLDNQAVENLLITGRQSVQIVPAQVIPIAEETVTVAPAASATPENLLTPTVVSVSQFVESTATNELPVLTPETTPTIQNGPVSTNSRFSGPVVGGVLALLVVGLAAGLALVVVKRSAHKR